MTSTVLPADAPVLFPGERYAGELSARAQIVQDREQLRVLEDGMRQLDERLAVAEAELAARRRRGEDAYELAQLKHDLSSGYARRASLAVRAEVMSAELDRAEWADILGPAACDPTAGS